VSAFNSINVPGSGSKEPRSLSPLLKRKLADIESNSLSMLEEAQVEAQPPKKLKRAESAGEEHGFVEQRSDTQSKRLTPGTGRKSTGGTDEERFGLLDMMELQLKELMTAQSKQEPLPIVMEEDEYEDIGTYSQILGLVPPQKSTPSRTQDSSDFGAADEFTSSQLAQLDALLPRAPPVTHRPRQRSPSDDFFDNLEGPTWTQADALFRQCESRFNRKFL
jgi:hypothetical protein